MVALGNFFFHYRTTLSPFLPLLLLLPGPAVLPDPFVAALLRPGRGRRRPSRSRHDDRARVHRARRP